MAEPSAVDAILAAEEELFPDPLPPPDLSDDAPVIPAVAPPDLAPAPVVDAPLPVVAPPPIPPPPVEVAAPPVVPPTEPPVAVGAPAIEPPKEPTGEPWKKAREAERKAAEAQEELNASRERQRLLEAREAELQRQLDAERIIPKTPEVPVDETDALVAAEQRTSQLEARVQQMEEAVLRQQRDTRLSTEAAAVAREHPEYPAAFQFYLEKEIEDAEFTGEIDEVATDIRKRAGKLVQEQATKQGITEIDAARALAKAVIYEQRVARADRAAQAKGTTAPQVVLELAKRRGFQALPAAAPAPPVVPPPDLSLSAAHQVRQEQASAASQSVASMPRVAAVPQGTLSYVTFMNMDTNPQGAMIDYLDDQANRPGSGVPFDWMDQLKQGATIPIPPRAT